MKYILANNATATLSAQITDVETSVVLADISFTMMTALETVDADRVVMITISDLSEITHENLEVTGWDTPTSTATVLRAREGTSGVAWALGSKAEIRASKGILETLNYHPSKNLVLVGANGGYNPYARVQDTVAILGAVGDDAVGSISIGAFTACTGEGSVAIGLSTQVYQDNCVAIGGNVYSNPGGIAIGGDSYATDGICIKGQSYGTETIVLGKDSAVYGTKSVVIGSGTTSTGNNSIAIGSSSQASANNCITIGESSEVYGNNSLSIGAQSFCSTPNCAHLAFIPIQNKSSSIPSTITLSGDIATRHRSAPLTTLASGIINLTDGTATAQIELPAGTHFFIDRLDVIITGVDTPGGTPAITVGTTAAGTDILGATTITKDALHQRQKIDPVTDDGVSDMHISVTTAGTGTTYNCRVIVVGYLVENE